MVIVSGIGIGIGNTVGVSWSTTGATSSFGSIGKSGGVAARPAVSANDHGRARTNWQACRTRLLMDMRLPNRDTGMCAEAYEGEHREVGCSSGEVNRKGWRRPAAPPQAARRASSGG